MIKIDKRRFDKIFDKAKKLKYSSMSYVDFDDCKKSEIIIDSDDLILLYDKNKPQAMIYYAANEFESVIKTLADIPGSLRLHFVPHEFTEHLKKLGFVEWGEYCDFWNNDLLTEAGRLNKTDSTKFLELAGCDEVSALSLKCRLQSRGFEGETPEWFAEWMRENKVIILQDEISITGFCCVSIYNNRTTLWIRELAVDPRCQGRGLGSKLMEHAIAYGAKNGAAKGFLSADILNKIAIGLYNKYGFLFGNSETELQMIKI